VSSAFPHNPLKRIHKTDSVSAPDEILSFTMHGDYLHGGLNVYVPHFYAGLCFLFLPKTVFRHNCSFTFNFREHVMRTDNTDRMDYHR